MPRLFSAKLMKSSDAFSEGCCCPCLLNPAEDKIRNTGLQVRALERRPELAWMRWPGTLVLFVFYFCVVASSPLASLAEVGGRPSVLGNFWRVSPVSGTSLPRGLDVALLSSHLFSLAIPSSFNACARNNFAQSHRVIKKNLL